MKHKRSEIRNPKSKKVQINILNLKYFSCFEFRISNFKKGFTLIETLIAISILMVVMVGPLTLAQRSLSSVSLTKEKMTAYFLAQDAIEYVRSVRDGNILSGNGWGDGFLIDMDSCLDSYCYPFTVQLSDPSPCGAIFSSCSIPLKYDTSSHLYGYWGTGANIEVSPYKRVMKIAPTNDHEVKIEVRVLWTSQGFGDQEIVLYDTLLNF